ncbi:hypothetical protein [Candidatus Nitrospira nitrificans]|uniref:Uncharacterized protein n=1 Tax=Candidatus Nitrospira nitrificans TaxID=1742973 RepID=A0A0S4L8X2_9BACT|nr:hypothetical protein [Candidatus Nitrospira nitrificans]CUS31570.1 hypothetical protein COMA2_10180 [Candidatus Nitrospira nitrificans]
MTVATRRKPIQRSMLKRRPMNLRTLQMMVQSGVVRRADFDPPTFGSRARFHALEEAAHDSNNEVASTQGWLSRIILGRRSPVSVPKRLWRG